MLRGLVLLFIGVNIALYFWINSDPHWGQSEREPQRLQHEVSPGSIQVLPDLPPGSTTPMSATDGASAPATAGSAAAAPFGASAASAGGSSQAPSAGTGLAHKTEATELACLESGPLSAVEWNALAGRLAEAGVPVDAITERDQHLPTRWMIYMGRFADAQALQRKSDELHRMGIRFDRVGAPPALDPGLSLGSFASAAEADARLADLGHRGVHSARVVEEASEVVRHMQVHVADRRWEDALPKGRFASCPTTASASL